MRTLLLPLVAALLAGALPACGDDDGSTGRPDSGGGDGAIRLDGGSSDGGGLDGNSTDSGDVDGGGARDDGGASDDGGAIDDGGATDDAGVCMVECAAPPPGCRYEGGVSCDPPRCPTLVCEDAGTSDGGAGDTVVCGAGSGGVFPTFERGCTNTESCVIARHQIDCCGTFVATGINHSERDRFDADEAICEGMYPACGCASRPTMADDGRTEVDGIIMVECRGGTCTTFVP